MFSRLSPPRAASGTLLAILLVFAAMLLPGCIGEPPTDPDPLDPEAPGYLPFLQALGIQQEMDRIARTIPPYLDDLPGADGDAPFEVERIADVTYRETPQRTLTLDVYRPITSDPTPRRIVVLYMGGGLVTHLDFENIAAWANFLASRGFVAFNTKQRLLTDEGVERRDILADAVAAARFAVTDGSRFGGDPNRVGVMGRSTGGQISLLVGYAPSPEYFGPAGDPDVPLHIKAVVDIFGPSDDARFFRHKDEFTLLPLDSLRAAYGGTPDEVPDLYAQSAPLTYVRPGLPPTLIVHGALDTTIPPIHSVILADRLEATGNFVQREFYGEFGHVIGWGLFNNDGFGRAIQAIVPFLSERL